MTPARLVTTILSVIAAVLYPALVYYSLVIRNIPIRHLSLFVIIFALAAFIAGTSKKKSFGRNYLILLAVGLLCLFFNSSVILKFYPLLMNLVFLVSFAVTLFSPPSMIFRFAAMQDKTIKGSLGAKSVEIYCRKVTIAWCGFFIFNGTIAGFTIFSGSDAVWAVYNGGISYFLIGTFFLCELLIRKAAQKKAPHAAALSVFKKGSRFNSTVLCYEGSFLEGRYKTWSDFLEGTAKLRAFINKIESKKIMLYCDDYWHFLLAFTALLQCKKEILLSANICFEYIKEIKQEAPLLTDNDSNYKGSGVFNIVSILEAEPQKGTLNEKLPKINADETSIVMYTSGSTGKPKEVRQRLTEFENDNKFVISKWGEELIKRKLCSTVSQQHIYGLLYSVLLPFTAGIPFRRKRIEFPEEIEKLTDSEYALITVPAFLKRAVKIQHDKVLDLKSPWIFSSGGVLDFQTAERANKIFGFWALEVYGSTETSGIAWRQSFNGPEWTPFDNAELNKNDGGCLVIRSPYIKDEKGLETADMAEIYKDGRFILKGRADSVVKIEEKRVSLTEVENRIMQSGLASDVCVISLEDRRQYLAAAVIFNEKGNEKFSNTEKRIINKFWRDYLSDFFEGVVIPRKWRYLEKLPEDSQGKKKREDIKNIFRGENE